MSEQLLQEHQYSKIPILHKKLNTKEHVALNVVFHFDIQLKTNF
jgi:hypothetical protein